MSPSPPVLPPLQESAVNFVSARAQDFCSTLYTSLAGYRYRVFVERLGWDLQTPHGFEQDQFDRPDTVHVVARADDGEIVGCGRLLPTTGPYLLEQVFPHLLNGLAVPRSPQVWELSRFAAMPLHDKAGARLEHPAERVLLQALRFCAEHGVTHLLAVSTLPVERLLQRAGVELCRLGPPVQTHGQWLIAFVIAVTDTSITALEAYEAAALGLGGKPAAASPRDGSALLHQLQTLGAGAVRTPDPLAGMAPAFQDAGRPPRLH
jgi:acyl homoserine lactone synthase